MPPEIETEDSESQHEVVETDPAAVQAEVDDLLEEFQPGVPSPEPPPAEEPAPEPPPAEEPAPEPPPAEEPAPEPPPAEEPKYRVGGIEYTAEEISANADLLSAVLTAASQAPHFQSKYQELLEQTREVAAARPAEAPPAEPTPVRTPADTIALMRPHVEEAVKEGFMEEDFATMFPSLAAGLMFFRNEFQGIQPYVAAAYQSAAESSERDIAMQTRNILSEEAGKLVALGDAFKALDNPEFRNEFIDFIADRFGQMTLGSFRNAETMKSVFHAFASGAPAQVKKQTAEKKANTQKKNLLGQEGGGARPPKQTGPGTKQDEIDDHLQGAERNL